MHLRGLVAAGLLLLLTGSPSSSQVRGTTQTILVFIDDLHIAFRQTPALRTAVRTVAERVPAAERSAGMASDGDSGVLIQPTRENRALLAVANRIIGAGLKPDDLARPTPAIEREIRRRTVAARAALQDAIATMRPDAVLYITEAQPSLTDMPIPIVMTTPGGIDAALTDVLAR